MRELSVNYLVVTDSHHVTAVVRLHRQPTLLILQRIRENSVGVRGGAEFLRVHWLVNFWLDGLVEADCSTLFPGCGFWGGVGVVVAVIWRVDTDESD